MSHPDPCYDPDNSYEDDEMNYHDDDAGDFDMTYYNDPSYEEDAVDEYDYRDEDYDDSMDGDHDSAMESAGWGTDEDYGYYGEDF